LLKYNLFKSFISSKLGNDNFFSLQSIIMWLVDIQSIPRITNNPYRGKHIRFTSNLRLSQPKSRREGEPKKENEFKKIFGVATIVIMENYGKP